MGEVVELFLLDDVTESKTIGFPQYRTEPDHFVLIRPGVILCKKDTTAQVLVKVDEFFQEMDETPWQCGCCGPEGSSRCGHVQTLKYLIDYGIIQLDRVEYPPTLTHHLVDESARYTLLRCRRPGADH